MVDTKKARRAPGENRLTSNSLPDFTLLEKIDPRQLGYDDWLKVGMALHHEGGTLEQFTAWSAQDTDRFHPGECAGKWASFNGDGVTWGSVVHLAKAQGWTPPAVEDVAYGWNDVIPHPREDGPAATPEPQDETRRYLRALFCPGESVRVVSQFWTGQDGRPKPGPGALYRLEDLLTDPAAIGATDSAAGVLVAVNPLEGGIKQENVTAFRHALIECDSLPIPEQKRRIKEMNLPCAAVVHSGGKSLHAIVKVDAPGMDEYKERVRYLHDVCRAYGFEIDKACRDAGRLTRLPGFARGKGWQSLLAVNIGAPDWESWVLEIEGAAVLEPTPVSGSGPMPAALFQNGPIAGGFGLVIGEDGIGKGWLTLDLLVSLALGREMNVRTVSYAGPPLKVVYVCYEDTPAALEWRLDRVCLAAGVDPALWRLAEKQGFLTICADDMPPLWEQARNDIPRPTEQFHRLERHIRRHGVDLCVIDPLAAAAVLQSENDNSALNAVAVQLRSMAKRTGCACLITHHTAKASRGSDHQHAARGGSALPGAGRWQLQLSQEARDKPLNLAVSKNSYGKRVFGVTLVQDETGVLREVTQEEIAQHRTALATAVLGYLRANPDARVNPEAVRLNNSKDAKAMIAALGAKPPDIYGAVESLLLAGELTTEDRPRPGRKKEKISILAIPAAVQNDDDETGEEEGLF